MDKNVQMVFSAIEKTIVKNIPELKQEAYRNKEYI